MPNVIFNDITLRDGEQSPGVNFFPEEKLKIATALANMKIPVVEAGFAVASQSDWEGVHLVAKEVGNWIDPPIICSMARAHKKDISAAYEALKPAKKPRIQVVLSTSDLHLEHKLKKTRDEARAICKETVTYAKTLIEDIEFAAEDATRTDIDFLCDIFSIAVESGARTLEIPDTVGFSTPQEYGELVAIVRDRVVQGRDIRIATHCHDDLGMAVANTLAGIAAGATQAECTINGIGERAGNASFEEVVMALRTRPDQFGGAMCGIETHGIMETSQLVSDLSGMVVAPNKAIVGKNAFRHESGIHQHGMLCNSKTYQIIEPEDVGATKFDLMLGKLSGSHALEKKIQELGLSYNSDAFNEIIEAFKDLCSKKKLVLDEDIISLVQRYQ